MNRFLALILALLLPSAAFAAGVVKHAQSGVVTLLTLADCADDPEDRRFTFNNFGGFALTGVQVNYTDDATTATTAITMTCDVSLDSGLTWAALQDCSVSSGTCTSSDATWSKTVSSASKNFFWRIDALSAPRLRCTLACTGGDANDTLSAWAVLSAE
jgi:hypothetical protein